MTWIYYRIFDSLSSNWSPMCAGIFLFSTTNEQSRYKRKMMRISEMKKKIAGNERPRAFSMDALTRKMPRWDTIERSQSLDLHVIYRQFYASIRLGEKKHLTHVSRIFRARLVGVILQLIPSYSGRKKMSPSFESKCGANQPISIFKYKFGICGDNLIFHIPSHGKHLTSVSQHWLIGLNSRKVNVMKYDIIRIELYRQTR